jgi:hypothetical protein
MELPLAVKVIKLHFKKEAGKAQLASEPGGQNRRVILRY